MVYIAQTIRARSVPLAETNLYTITIALFSCYQNINAVIAADPCTPTIA